MNGLASLLSQKLVGDLIGVIDLKRGQAVHAIAGQRSKYKAVRFGADKYCYGDPISLIRHYHRLGLRRLYVADLDCIASQQPQSELLGNIAAECIDWDEVLLDVGWHHGLKVPAPILNAGNISIVAATESADSPDALHELASLISRDRMLVGLDYRNGQFVSNSTPMSRWIAVMRELEINRCVVLDVASVGTGDCGSNVALCRAVKKMLPNFRIYSGGGIKSEKDINRLSAAGCTGFLVATSLHSHTVDAT